MTTEITVLGEVLHPAATAIMAAVVGARPVPAEIVEG